MPENGERLWTRCGKKESLCETRFKRKGDTYDHVKALTGVQSLDVERLKFYGGTKDNLINRGVLNLKRTC